MNLRKIAAVCLVAYAVTLGGCASSGSSAGGTGARAGSPANGPALPPIPEVTGPLDLYVEYPDSLQRITASDSNFVFGTVGTGDATLIIDGSFVKVEPNGAFLAFLPVPSAFGGDTARYQLVARRGSEVDTISHPILLPRAPVDVGREGLWLEAGGLEGVAERWDFPDTPIELAVWATPGARAWIESGRERLEMLETATPGRYRARIEAAVLHDAGCTGELECAWGEPADSLDLTLRVTSGPDTVSAEIGFPLRILDPESLPVVELREDADPVNGTNGIVVGRPTEFGPFRWRLPVGTRAVADARRAGRVRIRLAPGLHAWVRATDADELTPGTPAPTSRVGDLRFAVEPDRIRLNLSLADALPVHVEETGERTLEVTLFGAYGNTNRVAYGAGDDLLEDVSWEQRPGSRYVLRIRTTTPIWGYRVSYDPAVTSGARLRLEIHRPPDIDPSNPLAGRRIAIDPGHPGAGATGPTGYYEGDANLAIGRILNQLLVREGAQPILIRHDTLQLGLYNRTGIAQSAGAELYVSIHNNALPDGIRPFGREGTSTYYYHPHSRALAGEIHEGMLVSMGLRDLGVYWGDLAVARMSWMPSVLTEGAFQMMPDHEAALRNPEFQERYARGILEGLRAFLEFRAPGGGQ